MDSTIIQTFQVPQMCDKGDKKKAITYDHRGKPRIKQATNHRITKLPFHIIISSFQLIQSYRYPASIPAMSKSLQQQLLQLVRKAKEFPHGQFLTKAYRELNQQWYNRDCPRMTRIHTKYHQQG